MLTKRLRRLARELRERQFYSPVALCSLADSTPDPTTTTVDLPQPSAVLDGEFAALMVPANTFGAIELRPIAELPPQTEQISAQRRLISVNDVGPGIARLTYMRFSDRQEYRSAGQVDSTLWLGLVAKNIMWISSALEHAADLLASGTIPIPTAEAVFRAGRKTLGITAKVTPTLIALETERLDALYNPPIVPPGSLSLDTTDHAYLLAVREYMSNLLRGACSLPDYTVIAYPHIDNAWCMPETLTPHLIRGAAGVLATIGMESPVEVILGPVAYGAGLSESNQGIHDSLSRIATERSLRGGDMWMEPDVTLLSGESLMSQLLLARAHQAPDPSICNVTWLPDSPGFPSILPQLLSDFGSRLLYSGRLRFNEGKDRYPSAFRWMAPSGRHQILVYIANTPQGYLGNGRIFGDRQKLQPEGFDGPAIHVMGYSGGSVPTLNDLVDLEVAMAIGDKTPQPLWRTLRGIAEEDLAVIRGPLKLVAHRGVFSTHPELHRLHRVAEDLLQQAQAAIALSFPRSAACQASCSSLVRLRLELARLQAHDSIDATAPHDVNRRSVLSLTSLIAELQAILQSALGGDSSDSAEYSIVNLSGYPCRVQIDRRVGDDQDNFNLGSIASDVVVPAYSAIVETDTSVSPAPARILSTNTGFTLANSMVSYEVDRDGSVRSTDNPGSWLWNRLLLHADIPDWYDGWELDADYGMDSRCVNNFARSAQIIEHGPARVVVRIHYQADSFDLTQELRLWSNNSRLEFSVSGKIHDYRTVLRVYFRDVDPITALSTDGPFSLDYHSLDDLETTREIDEVPAQRWAFAHTQTGDGLLLLSTGLMGLSASGQHLGLSLCRNPMFPDPLTMENGIGAMFALARSEENEFLPAALEAYAQMSGSVRRTTLKVEQFQSVFAHLRRRLPSSVELMSLQPCLNGHIARVLNTSGVALSVTDIQKGLNLQRCDHAGVADSAMPDAIDPGEIATLLAPRLPR